MFKAEEFNQLGETMKKLGDTLGNDVLKNMKDLTEKAETIINGQNPVVREEEFSIGKHKMKAHIHKDGQVTIPNKSAGVVEEIIKRLRDDRHT